jgi:hypothetical protein
LRVASTPIFEPKLGRLDYLLLETLPERECSLAVGLLAVVGHRHEDDPLLFVNLAEQPPITYAVAPGGWVPVFQTLDVGTELLGLEDSIGW